MREGGDTGRPIVLSHPDTEIAQAFRDVAGRIAARVSTANATISSNEQPEPQPQA